jgi:transposase
VTIDREVLRAVGTFPTSAAGYRAMLSFARQWPDRVWAVEGANGVGPPVAGRLLADAERVLDVPAKLAARARVFDTGHGRKTDITDAHAVVMVALRDRGLRELTVDADLQVLRLLCDRRDELSRARAAGLNRAHRLFTELVPGGASVRKSVAWYRVLLAGIRSRDQVGRTRRRPPTNWPRWPASTPGPGPQGRAEAGGDRARVAPDGPARHRPIGAARILADVGDIARFPDRNHFAPWTGTPRSTPAAASRFVTGCPEPATGDSTTSSTSPRSCNSGTTPTAVPTTGASSPRARPAWRPGAASSAGYPTSSFDSSSPTPKPGTNRSPRRAREGHSEATLTSSAADPTPHVGTSDQPQTDSAERREESPPDVLEPGHNPAPSAAAAQDDSRAAASA